MSNALLSRTRVFALAGLIALALAGLAAQRASADLLGTGIALPLPIGLTGVTLVDSLACQHPTTTQPFIADNDSNWYTQVPGQGSSGFTGRGWSLYHGAKVVTTGLRNGATGTALDLPSGSYAVSPSICVTNEFPKARTVVRNVVGSEGVQFYVSYEGTKTWNSPRNSGQVHGQGSGWTLSNDVNVQPSSKPGWQIVRFVFVPGGRSSDFQLYDFWVDPRMKG
jgi:hypothetical protein